MAPNPIVNLIVQGAHARGLDPQAVLAVASQEGLSGRIGDGGHAYGPFQLNNAGGVITHTHPGTNDPRIQAWASSPDGINFALDHMAQVARGLRGAQAVSAIVSRFERPANIPREIAGANAAYGSQVSAAPPPRAAPTLPAVAGPRPAAAGVPTPRGLSAGLLAAVNTGNQMFGLAPLPQSLLTPPAPVAAPTLAAPPTRTPLPGAPVPSTLPLFKAARLAPVPGGLATRPGIELNSSLLPAVSQIAQRFGVKVNSGYRSPQHNAAVGGASHSDHLSGNAVDFTGPTAQMKALYQWAQGRFPYVEPWGQAGGNHVHISFQRSG